LPGPRRAAGAGHTRSGRGAKPAAPPRARFCAGERRGLIAAVLPAHACANIALHPCLAGPRHALPGAGMRMPTPDRRWSRRWHAPAGVRQVHAADGPSIAASSRAPARLGHAVARCGHADASSWHQHAALPQSIASRWHARARAGHAHAAGGHAIAAPRRAYARTRHANALRRHSIAGGWQQHARLQGATALGWCAAPPPPGRHAQGRLASSGHRRKP